MGFTKRCKDRAGLKSLGLFFFVMDVFFPTHFMKFESPPSLPPKPPTLVFQGQPSSMQFALCVRSSHGTRRVGFVLPERSGQPDSHQPDLVEPLMMYQKLGGHGKSLCHRTIW